MSVYITDWWSKT